MTGAEKAFAQARAVVEIKHHFHGRRITLQTGLPQAPRLASPTGACDDFL
jgi:hypothetical protein